MVLSFVVLSMVTLADKHVAQLRKMKNFEEFCSILDQISNGCHYFIISDRRLGMLPNGFRNAKF